ncbi:MAG: dihydrodipicolinate synthase family protein, partial [Methyloligellaceae bacterium]
MTTVSSYVPQGVIPATLLAFNEDFSINESESRRHLRHVSEVPGLSAITVNGHASEVHACTSSEQDAVLDLALDEVGNRLPIINGVYTDSSLEAARIAKMADRAGASALLCFPSQAMGMGCVQSRPDMARVHFETIAAATDLPLIVFHYGNELAYGTETLVSLAETIPSIKAVKDWSSPQVHETNIRTLQSLSRPVNVLTTNSAWLHASLTMGASGLLSGAGSVIADLQVALFEAVQKDEVLKAKKIAERMWPITNALYASPFGDMHNRMKEALVILGRQDRAI